MLIYALKILPPPRERCMSENFCVNLYVKYLYYIYHFYRKSASIYEWHILISLCLIQHKYVKVCFKKLPAMCHNVSGKLLCSSVDLYLLFSIQFRLYQIWMTYMNFKTLEDYLRELELAHTDRPDAKTFFNFVGKC